MRADASFTVRLFDPPGLAVRYAMSQRDASYPNIEYRNQTVGTASLMYVLLKERIGCGLPWEGGRKSRCGH